MSLTFLAPPSGAIHRGVTVRHHEAETSSMAATAEAARETLLPIGAGMLAAITVMASLALPNPVMAAREYGANAGESADEKSSRFAKTRSAALAKAEGRQLDRAKKAEKDAALQKKAEDRLKKLEEENRRKREAREKVRANQLFKAKDPKVREKLREKFAKEDEKEKRQTEILGKTLGAVSKRREAALKAAQEAEAAAKKLEELAAKARRDAEAAKKAALLA